MFRRLSFKEPSLTLTTSPCQNQTQRCHPIETRPLKTREYARIQCFPDDFEFSGTTSKIYKQIGNAVPTLLAYFIGKQIINCLNKIKINELENKILFNYFEEKIDNNNESRYKININDILQKTYMTNIEELFKYYFEHHIKPIYEKKVVRQILMKLKKKLIKDFLI